jgi:flagellar protein FliT
MQPEPDQLAVYKQMQAISAQMVSAAKANEWDRLVALETSITDLRNRLINGEDVDPLALTESQSVQKAAFIRQILENDAEIRRHVEPWMDTVRQFLGSQSQRRKMQHAYAAADISSESGTAAGAPLG